MRKSRLVFLALVGAAAAGLSRGGQPPAVTFEVPPDPLFVGSYVEVPVRVGGGLAPADVEYKVAEGRPGGLVSVAPQGDGKPERPTVMLCAGHRPGAYRLQALKKGTATVVGEAKFKVTAERAHPTDGPSHWFDGSGRGYATGAAWGGGPAGPQNVNTVPATGTRRVAILLVDTSSQRYPTDAPTLQAIRDRWRGEVVDGITGGDGVSRSARAYYREASYKVFDPMVGLDLTAEVFGPVSLTNSFDDNFTLSNGIFAPGGSFYQSCITAGDALIDYTQFDTVLCVSQSVTGMSPKSAWPFASIGNWGPWTTAEGNLNFGVISMPVEWGATGSRFAHETFAHELGHNLGLGDQYAPAVAGRNPGGWELMHDDNSFPHFSLAHRLMLGWVPAARVRGFNFVMSGSPVDETVTLTPTAAGAPPAGRFSGIEIRVADGWNYYLEYRRGQAAHIGDRMLPTDGRVVGTDVVSGAFVPPISRPGILLLPKHAGDDGAVLGNGQTYQETDFTDPTFPTDFRVDVSGITADKADVRIRYGVNSRPDPSIRPWPSPTHQWQSPDVEVRNARNAADAAWANVPWVGNPNTVVAKVRNAGALPAPGVVANFFVKDYTVGGAPETFIGTDTKDVAADATVEFTAPWTPPATGHYCVVVRLPIYQTPAPGSVVEMTEFNNLAQSNYDRFVSDTASPARRVVRSVTVGNPYNRVTRVHLTASQSNPLYRTYLEHTWLILQPGQTKQVEMMVEYAGEGTKGEVDKFANRPNDLKVAAFIEDPRPGAYRKPQVLGGLQAQVATGRGVKFDRFVADGQGVRGRVVTVDDGKPAPSGTVLLTVTRGEGKKAKLSNQKVELKNGEFAATLDEGWRAVRGYYLPPEGYGDATSREVGRP